MNPAVVETFELRKTYDSAPRAGLRAGRGVVAVDGVTLRVGRGEVFGFLGPNGAGKTTTIKMLLGLVHPTGGEARILGHAPGDPAVMGKVGFLPEHFRFPAWLGAAEFLDLHARLLHMDGSRRRARIVELLDSVGLGDRGSTRLGEFSKGMSQRIGLAQALLNEPDLVVLDEPTSGLDPLGRREVMELIRALRARGTTVFLNSHLLSEVEATCDRIAMIKKGRVVRTGTLDDLAGPQLEVDLRAEGMTREILDRIGSLGARVARADAARGEFLLLVDEAEALPRISAALVEAGARLYRLSPRRLSLEEAFVRIMGEPLVAEGPSAAGTSSDEGDT
jgi:ABC-2 type transport system ATP-binding protein